MKTLNEKKVAIVTGSSRGIGAAIAKQLLKDGYRVTTNSPDPVEACEPDLLELIRNSEDMIYVQADISLPQDRQKIVQETLETFGGKIHILCNNAGIAPKVRADMLECTEESWQEVMAVNLNGTMFMSQLVANVMKKQDFAEGEINGYIINTGSTSAWASSTNRAEYCASKAAVSMLTTLYADRMAEYGVLVYEMRPGVIDTNMTRVVHEKYTNLIKRGDFPIARWGMPEDCALAVSSLVEGKFRYSTGEKISVDGGYHIRRL